MTKRTSRIKSYQETNRSAGIEMLVGKIADLSIAMTTQNSREVIRHTTFYQETAERIERVYRVNLKPYNNVVFGLLANAYDPHTINVDQNNDLGTDPETLLEKAEKDYKKGDIFTATRRAELLALKYYMPTTLNSRLGKLFLNIQQKIN